MKDLIRIYRRNVSLQLWIEINAQRYLVDPCYENVPKKADHPKQKCLTAPLKRCKFITDQAWTSIRDPKKLSNRCACRTLPPKQECTSCFDSPTPLHAPRLRRDWPDK
ncbi:unnamed protein product [Diamesa serratosioi]